MLEFFKEINWRTSAYGIVIVGCSILGFINPDATTLCHTLAEFLIGIGFISSADAVRVQRVVDAVDGLLGFKKPILPVQPVEVPPVAIK